MPLAKVNVEEYIFGRPARFTKEFIENERLALIEWMKKPDSIYYKTFALERGYRASRLFEFAKVSEDFAATMEIVRDWQEARVAVGATTGALNANFSKFFMANVCNWKEKSETTISGSAANPLSFVLQPENQSKELMHGDTIRLTDESEGTSTTHSERGIQPGGLGDSETEDE